MSSTLEYACSTTIYSSIPVEVTVNISEKKLNEMECGYYKETKLSYRIYLIIAFFNPIFLLAFNMHLLYYTNVYFILNLCALLIYVPFTVLFLIEYYATKNYFKLSRLLTKIKKFTCFIQIISFCAIKMYPSKEDLIIILLASCFCLVQCTAYSFFYSDGLNSYIDQQCRKQYRLEMQNTPILNETLLIK